MLFVFDVDGTLIEGFLGTTTCEACEGEGRVKVRRPKTADHILTDTEPWEWGRCDPCKGKGQHFGQHLPYNQVTPLPGRYEKIRDLALEPDSAFALATNQGGVALGYQTVDEVRAKMARVVACFDFFFGKAFSVQIAMHHPKATVPEWLAPESYDLRKPKGGMIREAMVAHFLPEGRPIQAHNEWLFREAVVYVGDLATDRDAAEDAGVRFEWAHDFFR